MSITEFLEARIAEDERHAHKLAETDRRPVLSIATTVNHPERVLAECKAKRAIIKHARHLTDDSTAYWGYREYAERNLLILAAVYADHPDYLPEWAV